MEPLAEATKIEDPADVLLHNISQKLAKSGLKTDSSDSEKLNSLWKINLQLTDELQRAKDSEKKLKDTQLEEMKEVESYIEHIRHLSDERESLIQELEMENEALKTHVVTLEQHTSHEASQAEVAEMLTEQGLTEIAKAVHSEQIAYLLIERARLLDEINEHVATNNNQKVNTSETELTKIIEKERKEFEDELKQQRESTKNMSEQLKQEHEEEIDALMEENNKLEEDLQKAEMMVSQLKAELSKYSDKDDGNSYNNHSLQTTNKVDLQQLVDERNELNRDREELEKELEEIDKDRADLYKEKNKFQQDKVSFEFEKSLFNNEKLKLEQMKSEMENEKKELEQEKAAQLRKSQEVTKNKSSTEVESEKNCKEDENSGAKTLRRSSLSRSPSDLTVRKIIEEKTKVETENVQLKAQLRSLQKNDESHEEIVSKLKKEIEKCNFQQQQLLVKNKSLKLDLEEAEDQLEDTEKKLESTTKEKDKFAEMYNALSSEMKTLKTDAVKSNTLQDIVDILNNDKMQLSQSLESLKNKIDQAESEKNELANKNKFLSKGEQDLTNQLTACKQELEQVTAAKSHLELDKEKLLSLIKEKEDIETKLWKEIEETAMINKKISQQVETLDNDNKDLLNKLDKSREELDSQRLKLQDFSKQELVIEHLNDQNQQLQKQASISHDELVKSRDRETMLISTQQSLQNSHDSSEKSLEKHVWEIDDLKQKLELTLQELTKSKKLIEDLNKEKINLGESLNQTKKLLEENGNIKDMMQKEQLEKEQIMIEMKSLQSELEKRNILVDKKEEEIIKLEDQIKYLKSRDEVIKIVTEKFEKEQTCRESLEQKIEEMNKIMGSQVSKAQLISAQESAEKEKQSRQILEQQIAELELSMEEAESRCSLVNDELSMEKDRILKMESQILDLQSTIDKQVSKEKYSKLKAELKKGREALRESKLAFQELNDKLEQEKVMKIEVSTQNTELETSAQAEVVQLHKALNELNSLKSKLFQVTEELGSSHIEVDGYRKEIEDLKLSLQTAAKEIKLSDGKLKSMRVEVSETHGTLKIVQNQLKEKQSKLESVIQDKERLQRELDVVHGPLHQHVRHNGNNLASVGEAERQRNSEKTSAQEKLLKQLEQDNEEMSRKLADAVKKYDTLEEHLQKERLRNAEKYQHLNKYNSQQERDIISANNQIRQLREELHKHQSKVFRLEADNLGLTTKYQGTISRLEMELKDLKQRHGQEMTNLRDLLGSSSSDVTVLREQKQLVEQELAKQKLEISKLKSEKGKLDADCQTLNKLKSGLESRNFEMENELAEMWSDTRSQMTRIAALESTNQLLEQDVSTAKSTIKQLETTLAQKETVYDVSTKAIIARAELSERKCQDLQKQLEELTDKILNVEKKLAQAELENVQVQATKDTLLAVRHQLEGEKLQRSILDQTVEELKHQGALLKHRESKVQSENKELQLTILDLESHLRLLQNQSPINPEMQQYISEVGKDSLLDQITRLQKEVKQLQFELNNISERRDTDAKRYEERKVRTKAKLMRARSLYTTERNRYMEQMKSMDEDLYLSQATLVKEREWATRMDESYKMLLKEKRDLITQ